MGFQRYFTPIYTLTPQITRFYDEILRYQYFFHHSWILWPQKHRFRHQDCPSITKNRGVMRFQRFSWRPFCFWPLKIFPDGAKVTSGWIVFLTCLGTRINNKTSPIPQNTLRPKNTIWLYSFGWNALLQWLKTHLNRIKTYQKISDVSG